MASPASAPDMRMSPRPPRSRLTSIKNQSKRQSRRQAPKPVRCPECGSNNIEDYNGSTVCAECGTTINDSNIVSEVTFGETAAGAAVVQGAFIGADQRNAKSSGSKFGRSYSSREPREVSEMNGKEELRKQSSWHRLPEHIFDQAFSIYKLALNHNFIQGRLITVVSAVCLYAACRRDRDNQMLMIDFSEGIAVNVFRLGQTWTDLKKTLFLEDLHHRPVMEVEDLIAKFVRRLEFGKDMKKVTSDSLLLLRRMKRDWMVTGRLPGGLIGACIILAARMNNYRRTVREVVYVVKVGDLTISKRLEEFKRTPAATMSVEQFRKIGLRLKQGTPPAVYEGVERERKRKLRAMLDDGNVAEVTMELSNTEQPAPDMTVAVGDLRKTLKRRELRRDADGFAIPDPPIDPRLRDPDSVRLDEISTDEPEPPIKRPRGRPPGKTPRGPPVQFTEEDLISENQLEMEMETILSDTQAFMAADPDTVIANEEIEARSKALAESIRNGIEIPRGHVSDNPEITEGEFEDDPEVANCLLSEEETKVKERIWVTHNEDWLRAQQAKMLKKALADSKGADEQKQRNKKKRGKRRRIGDGSLLEGTPVSSAADATRIMLDKHGPSKHINYQTIDLLYKEFRGGDSSDGNQSRAASVAPSEANAENQILRETEDAIISAGTSKTLESTLDPQVRNTTSSAGADGLLTPAPTQPSANLAGVLEAAGKNGTEEQSKSGQEEPESGRKMKGNAVDDDDDDEEEDDYDDEDEYDEEAENVWNSDEEYDEVDMTRTAMKAGIDLGDMDEDETAGFSEHDDDD